MNETSLCSLLADRLWCVDLCYPHHCGFDSRRRRICCCCFLVGDSRPITYLTSFLTSMFGQCNAQKNNSHCGVLLKIILDIYIAIEYLWRYTRPIEYLCRRVIPTTAWIVLAFLLMVVCGIHTASLLTGCWSPSKKRGVVKEM